MLYIKIRWKIGKIHHCGGLKNNFWIEAVPFIGRGTVFEIIVAKSNIESKRDIGTYVAIDLELFATIFVKREGVKQTY